MKVDRIVEISGKKSQPIYELYYTKTLDETTSISVSRGVKHLLSCFLNKSKSSRIGGYRHIMTK